MRCDRYLRAEGVRTRFIELAGEINSRMPHHVLERCAAALDEAFGKGISASKVLLIGLAYKPDIDDTRESPALEIMQLLEKRGAAVSYHDPWVPVVPKTREHGSLAGRRSVTLTREEVERHDLVLVVADHADVDYALIAAGARLIVDTRNAFGKRGLTAARLIKA